MIGLLGFGTVGEGVYEILSKLNINIKKIAVKNLDKKRGIDKNIFTNDAMEIIQDPEIEIIIETTGDMKSIEWFKESFRRGKSVITANKAAVSNAYEELSKMAEENNVYFLYEAAVAGGIPILKTVKDLKEMNDIQYIGGILNGTSNYLATKVNNGNSYAEALKEAQELGYAEADPTSDVGGFDALRKLRILSTLAFSTSVKEKDIQRYGMEYITSEELAEERVLKQLALAYKNNGNITAFVIPALLSKNHILSKVNDNLNAVILKGNNSGSFFIMGEGAGRYPTANAVVCDLLDIIKDNQSKISPLGNEEAKISKLKGRFLLRSKNDINIDGLKEVAKSNNGTLYESDVIEFETLKDYKGELALLEIEGYDL